MFKTEGKGVSCYTETEVLATLLPSVVWKVGNVPNEQGDLAVELSKQSVEQISSCCL